MAGDELVPLNHSTSLATRESSGPAAALCESTQRFAQALQIQRARSAAEQRKRDRDAHHHKDLWAKRPHAGAYYKVEPQNSQLGQSHQSTGLTPEDRLGYEHVPHKGPTTNFVGDAMSTGALELVHEELRSGGQQNVVSTHEASSNSPSQPESDGTSNQQASEAANVAAFRGLWQKLESQGKLPEALRQKPSTQ